jgi:DNA modification methylase
METTHRVVVGDARELDRPDESVDLVVTSPPYPMIEMWDDAFTAMDSAVGEALERGDGQRAFEAMHDVLDEVWAQVARVLRPGGIACVNVGDATRTLDGQFRVYPNHARVLSAFGELGFDPLPDILWRKPANSAAKFMGSGMLPTNAYVTLEHEYVLVFRKGGTREFEPGSDRRYEAAYFWEERNRWFSDVWTDVTGERQGLADDGDGNDAGTEKLRERSAAFPFTVPYRLVNMYSVYGDTVLDPFWGTGTTSLAAMVAGRNSVGVERVPEFAAVFDERVADLPELSRSVVRERFARHREFVHETREDGDDFAYESRHYDFPVRTKQERDIRLYAVEDVTETEGGYRLRHEPVDEGDPL